MPDNAPNLSDQHIDFLLKLKPSDINLNLLREMFAVIGDNDKPKINYHAKFILTNLSLKKYSENFPETEKGLSRINNIDPDKIETTAGRYIANLFLFANSNIRKCVNYLNKPITRS